jgi:branched-chain amino acid transport system substrate-binding protein
MTRKLTITGLIAVLLIAVVFVVAGCGGTTTTTAATTATTAAAATTTTAAAATTTTAAGATTTAAAGSTTTAAASTGPATGTPIKVGVIASETGTAAPAFPAVQQGYQLEVDALNAAGGINGRPVQLITVDDKSDPATAVSAATKLITQDNVVALLGPLSTPCALAVDPLAQKYQVPLIRWDTPTLDSPATNAKWSFIASVGPVDVANALEKEIAAMGWKKIVAAADILPPNFQSLQILQKDAASKGFTIDYLKDTWQLDATDLSPQINKIYAAYQADKPDVLFVMSAVTQTSVLTKGLKALGVNIPIQDGPVAGHPAIFAQGPAAVEGVYVIGAGVLNPSQLPENYPNKQVMLDFVTRFQAKYKSPASLFAGLGYDSAHILFAGLQAGVDDKTKIRDGIEAISKLPISQGTCTFSPTDHALHGGYNEWQVKNGVFTFVSTLN